MSAQYLQFLILLGALAAVLVSLQWVMNRQAKRSEGHSVPDTSAVDGGVTSSLKVYYFYSQSCGPCRSMKTLTDSLCEEHDNLIKVDISKHSQLAREFGIAGVPSFIIVEDGVIKTVKLGRVSESWLKTWCRRDEEP